MFVCTKFVIVHSSLQQMSREMHAYIRLFLQRSRDHVVDDEQVRYGTYVGLLIYRTMRHIRDSPVPPNHLSLRNSTPREKHGGQ
jgi:hypothetical protein